MYNALAIDLDKTALQTDCTVSSETLRALEALKRAGVEIIICSGRSLHEIDYHAACLPRGRYIVALNGAQVFDAESETLLFQKRFACKTAADAASYLGRQYGLFFQMYYGDALYTSSENNGILDECGLAATVLEMTRGALIIEPLLSEKLASGELKADKFVCRSPSYDVLERAESALKEMPGISIASFQGNVIEVMPEGVDKGTGLRRVQKLLGLSKRQTLAIGDNDNDLPMFQQAAFCVAMGNALDTVKLRAQHITSDNDSDGVARAIRALFPI